MQNVLKVPKLAPRVNKQISENEEEIKVFYCLALKNEEEMWGKK